LASGAALAWFWNTTRYFGVACGAQAANNALYALLGDLGVKSIEVGRINRLRVLGSIESGFVLAAEDKQSGTAVLANRYAPDELSVGDEIDVFVYSDTGDRLLATTQVPKAMVGEIAYLRVMEINQTGAFLDWGLPKELLLPYGEQKEHISEGGFCTVFIHKDKYSLRAVASQRLNRHIGKTPANYRPGEKVAIQVVSRTDLGYKAVVNNSHWGLLYENEVFKPLRRGLRTTAWISRVVADEKVDLSLSPPHKERFSQAAEQILAKLEAEGGFLKLHDKSPPEDIRACFGMSKKNFKAALGKLYKERLIAIESEGIRLVEE
jgi:predicted RNA-binding protein (virulence factor B family)